MATKIFAERIHTHRARRTAIKRTRAHKIQCLYAIPFVAHDFAFYKAAKMQFYALRTQIFFQKRIIGSRICKYADIANVVFVAATSGSNVY